MSDYIDEAAAAAHAGVPVGTVRAWVRVGRKLRGRVVRLTAEAMPYRTPWRAATGETPKRPKYRFRREWIDQFLAAGRVNDAPAPAAQPTPKGEGRPGRERAAREMMGR